MRIVLNEYLKGQVTVYYGSGSLSDTGRITYMDSLWVEITKERGERLLVPIPSIRVIRLIEPGHIDSEAATLLRAAAASPSAGAERSREA